MRQRSVERCRLLVDCHVPAQEWRETEHVGLIACVPNTRLEEASCSIGVSQIRIRIRIPGVAIDIVILCVLRTYPRRCIQARIDVLIDSNKNVVRTIITIDWIADRNLEETEINNAQ